MKTDQTPMDATEITTRKERACAMTYQGLDRIITRAVRSFPPLGVHMILSLAIASSAIGGVKTDAEGNGSESQPVSDYGELPTQINAAWIRRLADSKSTNAVHLLEKAFRKHQKAEDPDESLYLDVEIVNALGTIPGEISGGVLMRILTEVWDQGPRNVKQPWDDGRYMAIMRAAIRGLGTRDDPNSLRLLQQLAASGHLAPTSRLKVQAYRWRLEREIVQQDLEGPQETVGWLYDEYMRRGGRTNALVTGAFSSVLYGLGAEAVPALELLSASVAQDLGQKSWGALWLNRTLFNCRNAVKHRRRYEPGIPRASWRAKWGTDTHRGQIGAGEETKSALTNQDSTISNPE
jgi:hypothetical protein